MKIHPTCVPCLIKRVLFEAEQCTTDEELKGNVLKTACSMVSDLYRSDTCSADIATIIHKKIYSMLDTDDPYKQLKTQSNQVALSMVPKVESLVKNAKDPLYMSILCAIIGNALDFGISGASKHPDKFLVMFDTLRKQGIGYDDTPLLRAYLKNSTQVLFFTDNCGEIIFDKILLSELKKHYPHLTITLVVKGTPILSDATKKDALEFSLSSVVDTILTTGCYAVGVNFSKLPVEVKKSLDKADLIICKGMANYESFSETSYGPIAYLLRTKCQPIADSMDVPVHSNIVKVYEK